MQVETSFDEYLEISKGMLIEINYANIANIVDYVDKERESEIQYKKGKTVAIKDEKNIVDLIINNPFSNNNMLFPQIYSKSKRIRLSTKSDSNPEVKKNSSKQHNENNFLIENNSTSKTEEYELNNNLVN